MEWIHGYWGKVAGIWERLTDMLTLRARLTFQTTWNGQVLPWKMPEMKGGVGRRALQLKVAKYNCIFEDMCLHLSEGKICGHPDITQSKVDVELEVRGCPSMLPEKWLR